MLNYSVAELRVEQFASLTLNKICLASTQPRTAQSFFYLEPVFALCLTRLIVTATHIKMCANASSAFDLATVLLPTRTYACHIIDRLRSTHVAILNHRIVIISRLSKLQHIVGHVSPSVRVTSILSRQGHSVTHMKVAAIIACQHKVYALIIAAHIAKQPVQLHDVTCRRRNIGLGVLHLALCQPQAGGGRRHNLHQSACSSPRVGFRVEGRLLITLCSHQSPVPSTSGSIHLKIMVIR